MSLWPRSGGRRRGGWHRIGIGLLTLMVGVSTAVALDASPGLALSITASSLSYQTPLNTTLTVPASSGLLTGVTDPNAGAANLTAALRFDPGDGTVVVQSDGSFVYTPDTGYVGPDSFVYSVCDNLGFCNRELVANISVGFYIQNEGLPEPNRLVPYSTTLTAAGGVPPYTWTKVSGALPPGLKWSATTATISGTPRVTMRPGTFTLTFKVHDSTPHVHLSATTTLTMYAEPEVFVSDLGNDRIVAVDQAGMQRVVATGLNTPNGVAVDNHGAFYVSESGAGQVDKFTPNGLTGTYTKTVIIKKLQSPGHVAVDSARDVFVADTGNHRVVEKPFGKAAITIATGLASPVGLAVDGAHDVYVGDTSTGAITEIAPDHTQTTLPASVVQPNGLAVDASGDLFIADGSTSTIQELSGGVQSTVGLSGLNHPNDVALDPDGNLYVADHDLNQVVALLWGSRSIEPLSGVSGPNAVALG